jgi:hypothetical protein
MVLISKPAQQIRKRPTMRSQNGTQESRKMRLFLGKSALFAILCPDSKAFYRDK